MLNEWIDQFCTYKHTVHTVWLPMPYKTTCNLEEEKRGTDPDDNKILDSTLIWIITSPYFLSIPNWWLPPLLSNRPTQSWVIVKEREQTWDTLKETGRDVCVCICASGEGERERQAESCVHVFGSVYVLWGVCVRKNCDRECCMDMWERSCQAECDISLKGQQREREKTVCWLCVSTCALSQIYYNLLFRVVAFKMPKYSISFRGLGSIRFFFLINT